jgi:hypothetical protein
MPHYFARFNIRDLITKNPYRSFVALVIAMAFFQISKMGDLNRYLDSFASRVRQ